MSTLLDQHAHRVAFNNPPAASRRSSTSYSGANFLEKAVRYAGSAGSS